MLLSSISRTREAGSRLSGLLRGRGALVERGLDAAAEAAIAGTAAAAPLMPATRSRSHRQTAVTVAAVAVGAAAVGAAAYIWWRHRRDQEFARLLDPEPQRPEPMPAEPPDEPETHEPPLQATPDESLEAVAEAPVDGASEAATEEPAVEEPAPALVSTAQPSPQPGPQPRTEAAPRAGLDVVVGGSVRNGSRRPRTSRPSAVGRPFPGASVTRIPAARTRLPSGAPAAPRVR
ncbi:MAG: hypothetical protein V3S31_08550 [Dehalococcoidia bacterium]